MEKDTLRAVDDSDLERLLRNLGVLDAVRAGKASCKYCSDNVTFANLAALFPEGGTVKLVCNRSECIAALAESQSQLRGRKIG